MDRRKFLKVAAATPLVAGAVAGCTFEKVDRTSGSGTSTTTAVSNKVTVDPYDSDNEIKIAYVAHDLSTPNNQAWLEGIERECESWDNITIDSFNGESSAETQVTLMSDIINQGYNAIILQCSDGTSLASSVAQAEAAGIPVITINLDCSSDTVHSCLVMAVDYDAGRLAADAMAEQMGEEGGVAIIQGVPGLTRTDNLEQGFRDTIANYPNITIVGANSASFEKEEARTVMEAFMQQYDDMTAVFAINDAMAEGAALAADNAGKTGDYIIWGADGESDALTMIENGQMSGTIYTNSWDEGSTAAKIALLMIGSEYSYTALSATPQVVMEPIVVTIDNVAEIAEEDRW